MAFQLCQICPCIAIVWWLLSEVVYIFVPLLVVQQLRLLHAY